MADFGWRICDFGWRISDFGGFSGLSESECFKSKVQKLKYLKLLDILLEGHQLPRALARGSDFLFDRALAVPLPPG